MDSSLSSWSLCGFPCHSQKRSKVLLYQSCPLLPHFLPVPLHLGFLTQCLPHFLHIRHSCLRGLGLLCPVPTRLPPQICPCWPSLPAGPSTPVSLSHRVTCCLLCCAAGIGLCPRLALQGRRSLGVCVLLSAVSR